MSRKPDYRLGAMNKATDEKSNIGGAWINEDGTISIALDAFVQLTASKNLVLTLFQNNKL